MRIGGWLLAVIALTATGAIAANVPKGCYEKSWNKWELKKLPQQEVTELRVEVNLGTIPDSKPQAYGRLMARFRSSGETWLETPYECSDTGAGFACASYCDGSVFVLSASGGGLQVMPPNGVMLAGPDCNGDSASLKMNADQQPFQLARRGSKACPSR